MALQLQYTKLKLEAGCDEAGRGCLAGPVVAAAVVLPPKFHHPLLNDSKQLTKKNRDLLKPIIQNEAISWGLGLCSPMEIDKINILNASFLAMHRAIEQLNLIPEYLLIDGNRFKKYKDIPHTCMVKGDARFANIAAASVLAKTYRDEIMEELHAQFPLYGWNKNMGYPTIKHRQALESIGISEHHRKTYRLFKDQLTLF